MHAELRTDGVIGVQAICFRRATCDRTSKPCDVSLVSASEPSFSRAISSPSVSRNWAFAVRAACQAT
jgi:hypothetical protein